MVRRFSIFVLSLSLMFAARANASIRFDQFYDQWRREVGHRLEWAVRSQVYVNQAEDNFTLLWLGGILKVHQTLARQFLLGQASMSLDHAGRAADAFGVQVGWLLAFEMIRTELPISVEGIPLATYRNFKPIVQLAMGLRPNEIEEIRRSPCLLLLKHVSEDDLVKALRDRGWTLTVRPKNP